MLTLPGETLILTRDPRRLAADALRSCRRRRSACRRRCRWTHRARAVLRELGRRQCNDVLVEAGPTLAGQFLELDLADELVVYLAPMLLGPQARADGDAASRSIGLSRLHGMS